MLSLRQRYNLDFKGINFYFAEFLGRQTLEPFINLDVSIKEQVLTLEYFDENDEVRSKTIEGPINTSTIFRLSNIHDKVLKTSHFDIDLKNTYCWFSCLTKTEPK